MEQSNELPLFLHVFSVDCLIVTIQRFTLYLSLNNYIYMYFNGSGYLPDWIVVDPYPA